MGNSDAEDGYWATAGTFVSRSTRIVFNGGARPGAGALQARPVLRSPACGTEGGQPAIQQIRSRRRGTLRPWGFAEARVNRVATRECPHKLHFLVCAEACYHRLG
jgi:hypothetical protein